MNDTNYISGIIKILEIPKEKILKNNIQSIKFRAQLPQMSTAKILTLTIWGNLANDVKNYYKINDYLIIEGYISLSEHSSKILTLQSKKKMNITVLRVYPFLLN